MLFRPARRGGDLHGGAIVEDRQIAEDHLLRTVDRRPGQITRGRRPGCTTWFAWPRGSMFGYRWKFVFGLNLIRNLQRTANKGKDAAEIRGTVPTQTGWAKQRWVRVVVATPGAWAHQAL